MKFSLAILALCFVAAKSVYIPYGAQFVHYQPTEVEMKVQPVRPNFDCDRYCGYRPSKPVCSTENKTFKNECYLECAWAYKECDGQCPCLVKVKRESFCYCEKTKDPVCTYGGETKDNKCIAECEGKPILHKGPCFY